MAQDTLRRQWLMLLYIPAAPRRRSTREIASYLEQQGESSTVRTVQRDLERLSGFFQYTSDVEGRTNYWYFPLEQRVLEIPGMSSGAALALLLAREHLTPLIPPTTLKLLKPYFGRAEEALKESIPVSLATWKKRVKVMTRGPVLRVPKITDEVQQEVYEAVLLGRQLSVNYRGRGAGEIKESLLHPRGLVVREGMVYLVASAWDYPDLRHYALHRLTKAQCLEDPIQAAPDFDLNEYVEREFRYPVSPTKLRLVARFDAGIAQHLEERPLSDDQTLNADGEWTELRASVVDTDELRWWLLGFGEGVEVIGPAKLRKEMRGRVQAMARLYTY